MNYNISQNAGSGADIIKNIRIAVCGELPTACDKLREAGVVHIDMYSDALDLAFDLRKGSVYHFILVYAPQGEGLTDTSYPYKTNLEGKWINVPVRLLNEPACHSALTELVSAVHLVARQNSNIM